MNRKVLLLVLLVGIAGVVGTYVTTALFTDQERSGSNTFSAGTLDLAVDGSNDAIDFESFDISNIGADGVVSGGKTWTISNSGTVDGFLNMSITGLTNTENGCNEPELKTEPACEADNLGELGAAIASTLLVDRDANDGVTNDEQVIASTLATANQDAYATAWSDYAAALPEGFLRVPAGESVDVTLNWGTSPADYDNSIQSDGVAFTVQFDLTQVTPTN